MESIQLYSSDDKIKWWGNGEWVEEPDLVTFEHEGIPCVVKRIKALEFDGSSAYGGHLCGYVNIPPSHPWVGKAYDVDSEVHGGITFNDDHLNGAPKGFYTGFDCGHSTDIVPSMKKYFTPPPEYRIRMNEIIKPTYKNMAFAIEETKRLAEEASKAKVNQEIK